MTAAGPEGGDPATELLALAGAGEAPAGSIAVVGTSKNAGKTVVIAALAEALARAGMAHGLASIGRDGEAVDALDGGAKPRFFLRPGVLLALPAGLLPRYPALELVAATPESSALGRILLARVRAPGYVEIAGPPEAAALRRVVNALRERTGFVLVDGAVDRVAALRGGGDAIVVAVGAATAPSLPLAAEAAGALVDRLRIRPFDPAAPALRVAGALTAEAAAEFVRRGERRAIVVRDATHIVFGGRIFATFAAKLDLRCEVPLRVVACTVAPIFGERAFEPRAFARAVARRTGLPVFDIYAGTCERVPAA